MFHWLIQKRLTEPRLQWKVTERRWKITVGEDTPYLRFLKTTMLSLGALYNINV